MYRPYPCHNAAKLGDGSIIMRSKTASSHVFPAQLLLKRRILLAGQRLNTH